MQVLRWMVVVCVALVPLATLAHRDDVGRWDRNRSAMAAPDEFSYLLLADNLIHGAGISTQGTIGRDTFYPPGFPLLLAGWGFIFGLTVFHAHVLNAGMLCLATWVVYALARRLLRDLGEGERPRFQFSASMSEWIAVLIAGLFAMNWHVLEGGLYVFSEPAFMLVTFVWLVLSLRWRQWHQHFGQAIVLSLLAIVAWSIRGAGIVCVGTMALYPVVDFFQGRLWRRGWPAAGKIAASLGVLLLLAVIYQGAIAWVSPEKSLASDASANNSYKQQLLGGLTKNGTIDPTDPQQWPAFAGRIRDLLLSHLDDYGSSFTPWFRESPDFHLLNIVGKAVGILGLLGWLNRFLRQASGTRFVEIYVWLYIALYLVWPFDMARFWAPILPVMLVYGVDAVRQFWGAGSWVPARTGVVVLLALLLGLYAEELVVQLGNYERRLNYVSDALATAAATVVRLSPDPAETIVAVAGSDEHFLYAWYLPHGGAGRGRYLPRSPEPHIHGPGSRRETVEELLVRSLKEARGDAREHLFVIGYFTEPCYPDMFEQLRKQEPELWGHFTIRRVFQKEIVATVWEFERKK